MKKRTEWAIRTARRAQRDPQFMWRQMEARLGRDATKELYAKWREQVERGAGVVDTSLLEDEYQRDALTTVITHDAFAAWADLACPVVLIPEFRDAVDLGNTDPPSWLLTSPHGEDEYSTLGIEVGECFGLVLNWRDGNVIWIGDTVTLQEWPFKGEVATRLIQNIGFIWLERPDGFSVGERPPSARANRKRGRKYYPGVEYIIQSSRPLHPPEPVTQGPSRDGGKLSVRTLVRGHWKQQPYGPGNSQRKLIWIRPAWRGPSDAPISIHPTRLKSSKDDDGEDKGEDDGGGEDED